ncbi:hypothetical protein M135_3333 [Bacteroides fragilis str. S36L5]|uniref:Uncharacterized protein n=1 Tax=Bacteroides fragilis str. S36L11 TaxID=1339327 RepID=A0A015X105_BACFG|nr:hypothetical protein [Bacteroides fragilis]EXZ27865.1 hypothetical protein M136_2949 [Bacteroides fragilis str. S36L11]EYA84493.1 hypothetical protein M137_3699 [Bacteroides fragilis str. S36L12]EYA90093.1 hypothetical protein M135_3333 [Bacteroides fragilis str. S36L5]
MKNLTWQNPEQLFVAQELINKVKSKCCGIKVDEVSSKVLITFNNEINAQNAMKQITDNLSTTINHILTISQQNIQILE